MSEIELKPCSHYLRIALTELTKAEAVALSQEIRDFIKLARVSIVEAHKASTESETHDQNNL
jgi:hypothetical protein